MEIRYRPPLNDVNECNWLENNMLTCLREKSVKDELPRRFCKVENLLWFFLECPNRSDTYDDPQQLRKIFIQQQKKEATAETTQVRQRK